MTYEQVAQEALDIQNASNLSGVVHSFSRAMTVIWEQAHSEQQGTEWVNTHPIVTLYLDKLASLNGYGYDYVKQVNEAYDKVKALAQPARPRGEYVGHTMFVEERGE